MALTRNVKPGDILHVGDGITIAIERASGQRARVRITDPNNMPIRHESNQSKAETASNNGEESPVLTRSLPKG